MTLEVFQRERRIAAQNDNGLARLAAIGIGNADYDCLGDSRMGINRAFNVGGIDIVAAGDDHVLEAIDDEQIAVLVEIADIAGPKEPIDHRTLGLVLAVPVALRDLRTGNDDLAALTAGHPLRALRGT